MAVYRSALLLDDWNPAMPTPPTAAYHYICDTEAELPTVPEGCTAYTKDSQKQWKRTNTAWVDSAGSGGAPAWGAVTGTLSNQTDLQSALDGKSGTGHTHAQLHDRQHSVTAAADHTFPGGTTTFLRADGTFATPAGGSGLSYARIAGASGAGGDVDVVFQILTADSSDVTSSTTPAVVMTTTGVGSATRSVWRFKYLLFYQTAALTTGIGITVNHTGASAGTQFVWTQVTSGGAAAVGIGDGVTTVNAGQLVEGKAERVINTVSSKSAGVDTINASVMATVEGMLYAPNSGSLELKIVSEVNGSAVRIMVLSFLELFNIG